ncbi:MAG: alkaline phosphatase family protein [Proteobacteria bacterium]|nr:alkaline phosphatase family protein [Pseudomonadota bacterium]
MAKNKKEGFFTAGRYLRKKYGFLGRFVQKPSEAEGKGLILLQIDGISYPALLEAMGRRYTPTLRRLVHKNGYRLVPWYCPPPSNTPSIQAGIMYGINKGIPGFRWFDKKSGRHMSFKDPEAAASVEDALSKNRMGLLKGGSSYLNLYTGGAKRSVFTLSTFASENILRKKKLRQLDIFILFFLRLTNLFRTAAGLIADSVLEFGEWLYCLMFSRERRREGIFPIIRLINNVIFRELETMGAVTDIMRGVPSVYLTYNGYDEMAHHRGPRFSGSFRALRGIDRQLRKIARASRCSSAREYDLFIFSDHGQTPSIPFVHLYGERLADLIQRATPETLEITEFHSPEEVILHEGSKYMEELGGLLLRLPQLFFKLFDGIRRRLFMEEEGPLPFEWEAEKEQVVVSDSGPLSHLYFNFRAERIPTAEIETKYPSLLPALTEHPGIGVIIGRDDKGRAKVIKWDKALSEDDRSHLLALSREENSGDIILQGTFDGRRIVNFEEQLSGHGGIGGEQNHPFFMTPQASSLDASLIKEPSDLYTFFFDNYTKHAIKKLDRSKLT